MQGQAAGYASVTKIVIKCNIGAEKIQNLYQFVEEGFLSKKVRYSTPSNYTIFYRNQKNWTLGLLFLIFS